MSTTKNLKIVSELLEYGTFTFEDEVDTGELSTFICNNLSSDIIKELVLSLQTAWHSSFSSSLATELLIQTQEY